jgi:hypothetical protein
MVYGFISRLMFYIEDYLELEELLAVDIKRFIYPVDLPAFFGPPPQMASNC